MVGENGPELFVPSGNGSISNNSNSSTSINVHFDFTNANIVDRDTFIRQVKDVLETDMRFASLGVR